MEDRDPRLPSYDDIIAGARIHAAASAMQQSHGNITIAASLTKTSRRTIRQWLKAGGLHPWRGNIYTPLAVIDLLIPPIVEDAGVIEDGRKGRVTIKCETFHEVTGAYVGPAFLLRGDEAERLWAGEWVTWHRARVYAQRNGHEF